ncbi:epidermal growth factor-like protein 6 [Budorcas taxicolor]|uniref:epidermal growth factor-like protein 6 n=1 Tax=Budorcas taxicolor TaxID=37181 RepID=UPI002283B817|nr:epidermal growth factor-like protein 6 [Budorcas taxicolor]
MQQESWKKEDPAKTLQPWALALPLLLFWVAGGVGKAASPRDHALSALSLQPGVCRYGTILACCYGWRRSSKGVCEALCEPGCKFGECVGPNKCRCFPGYTGKTCSQDVNECGFKPRPCQHRCVNTHGSYKCFCLSSHMLLPNATCPNSWTCAMTNCQYGCKDTEEGPRCLCPSPGLRLAHNGRACLDIDECVSDKAFCPYNRRCVNTFGSYYCKGHVGFELKYISGLYDCVDINECAATTHTCSLHANCLNTQGSFKCKCKQGYKGSGLQCALIPENSVKEFLRAPGTIKDRIKKLLAHKNSMRKKVKMKNITEPRGTPTPKVDSEPFSSEESISRDGNPHREKKRNGNGKKERLEDENRDENHVVQEQSLRGDVFSSKVNEVSEVDLVLVQRKTTSFHLKHKAHLNISVDCTFDHGVCDWKQDIEDDFDWNPADRDNVHGWLQIAGYRPGPEFGSCGEWSLRDDWLSFRGPALGPEARPGTEDTEDTEDFRVFPVLLDQCLINPIADIQPS